jgi:hypothetical protein
MNNEASTFIFHNCRPALQHRKVNSRQMKGMGSYESHWASSHNYHFEVAITGTHSELLIL